MEKKKQYHYTIEINHNNTQNINIPIVNNDILKNNYTTPHNINIKYKDERPSLNIKGRREGLMFNNINFLNINDNNNIKTENKILNQNLNNNNNIEPEKKIGLIKKIFNLLKKFETSFQGYIFIIVIIFISIIINDLKELFISAKYKLIFSIINLLIMLIYIIDLIYRYIIIENLIFSLFFWFDILSWVTMLFDFDNISYPFIQKLLYPNKKNDIISFKEQMYIELFINLLQIIKLTRVVKIYKILTDIRKEKELRTIVKKKLENKKNKEFKISKALSTKKHKKSTNIINFSNNNNNTLIPLNQINSMGDLSNNNFSNKNRTTKNSVFTNYSCGSEEYKKMEKELYNLIKKNYLYNQSRIGIKTIDGVSRLMIIIIICVLVIGLFTDADYNSDTFGYKRINKLIDENYEECVFDSKNYNINLTICLMNIHQKLKDYYLMNNIKKKFPIISIYHKTFQIYQNISFNVNENNISEKYYRKDYSFIYNNFEKSRILICKKKIAIIESLIYLMRIVFIIVSFSLLIYFWNDGVNKLLFKPLEKIEEVIDLVSKDPVNSKTVTNLRKKNEKKNKLYNVEGSEIILIQNTLIRISALMAIGFGEAGGEILKKNISSSEGLNPMLQGNKIKAIFGFCYIHNFSEINEAFQEKTMIFVNQISDIVHSCVDKFKGIINKNLGDSFLLAWKFRENNGKENYKEIMNPSKDSDITIINETADCALLSFLNIIKKINKSHIILAYKKDPDIIKKFGNKYSIQMGFGLHTGWGIEGAIGSFYKIDCSYLSPNVNIAARLETATNIYSVDILMSNYFYDLLSDDMKIYCRKIDIVTVKGSVEPLTLYTVDINKNIKPGKLISKKDRLSLRERRQYFMSKKNKLWEKYKKSNLSIGKLYIKQSRGLRETLKTVKCKMFYTSFEDGLSEYIDGNWDEAYQNLLKARYLYKNDGPTKTLLDFIKMNGCIKPNNWKGYRELTSKT